MIADSSLSISTVHQPRSDLLTQIESEKVKPIQKRRRTSPANPIVESAIHTDLGPDTKNSDVNAIQRWIKEESWPGGDSEQDSNRCWSLVRKRSTPSLSKHESDISSVSMIEGKNPAVKSRRYEQSLLTAGIYMDDDDNVAPSEECKALCWTLLDVE